MRNKKIVGTINNFDINKRFVHIIDNKLVIFTRINKESEARLLG